MRRLLCGAISAAAGWRCSPRFPPHAADPRITNGGFDNGLTGWRGSRSPGGVTAVTWGRPHRGGVDDTRRTTPAAGSLPGLSVTAGARYTAYGKVWTEGSAADLYPRFRVASGQRERLGVRTVMERRDGFGRSRPPVRQRCQR